MSQSDWAGYVHPTPLWRPPPPPLPTTWPAPDHPYLLFRVSAAGRRGAGGDELWPAGAAPLQRVSGGLLLRAGRVLAVVGVLPQDGAGAPRLHHQGHRDQLPLRAGAVLQAQHPRQPQRRGLALRPVRQRLLRDNHHRRHNHYPHLHLHHHHHHHHRDNHPHAHSHRWAATAVNALRARSLVRRARAADARVPDTRARRAAAEGGPRWGGAARGLIAHHHLCNRVCDWMRWVCNKAAIGHFRKPKELFYQWSQFVFQKLEILLLIWNKTSGDCRLI